MESKEQERNQREDEEAIPAEEEDAILDLESKLYRLDKEGNLWKERGVGSVKLLKHKEIGNVRLVMSREKLSRFVPIISEYAGNEKSWVRHAVDYFANGELKDEMFYIRFGSVECKNFKKMFLEVAENQKTKEENKDASATAGLLERLAIEELNWCDSK